MTITQLPPLPPLVVEDFNWETPQEDAPIHQRRVNGFEAIVGSKESNAAGANDLYLIASVRFSDAALTLSQLQVKVERSLVRLRYEHPEISQTAVWEDDNPFPSIRYQPPKSTEDALRYAHEVVRVRAGPETGLDIRDESEAKRHLGGGSKPAEAVAIDIVAPVPSLDVALGSTDMEFVFHTNHLYFDGISKRVFVDDLFRHLGVELSAATADLPDFRWGEEVHNLEPPVLTVLKEGVETQGPKFEEHRAKLFGVVMRGMKNWGMECKPDFGLPRAIFHTFTEDESIAIYKAVKSKVGPSASPAHLGHAAVLLALLKINPTTSETDDSQIYISQSAVNGRRFLQNPEKHSRSYRGAQAVCPVLFENIKQYDVVGASKEKLNEYLIHASQNARSLYAETTGEPRNLPSTISLHNIIAQMIASGQVPESSVSAPLFTSDGINETYIQREVTDKAGNVLMSVNKVRFLLNQYMPFMFVRLDSWRGRSEFSLSYNDGHYTTEQASEFLKEIVKLVLQFAQ